MAWLHAPHPSVEPRVLFVSHRRMTPVLSRCLRFEFEDVIQSFDGADLVAPERPPIASRHLRRVTPFVDALAPGAGALFAPGLPELSRRYDVAFVACESLEDLPRLQPLSWLRRKARVAVCYLDELYREGFRERSGEIRALREFDRIFLSFEGSVELVAEVTGRPCHFLPPSVDALRLCPYPNGPRRVIDVYAMGRRPAETHEALLELADARGWFYLYDTVRNAEFTEHREHRSHLGDLIRRSRYFLVNAGKQNLPRQTGGQQELGYRFFEGAAGGAILFGDAPRAPSFGRLFGWPDSVIDMPYASREVGACLQALEDDPERVDRARRTNVVQSLLRHDHVYRWADVLAALGLPGTPAMDERRRALRALAEVVAAPAPARGSEAPAG